MYPHFVPKPVWYRGYVSAGFFKAALYPLSLVIAFLISAVLFTVLVSLGRISRIWILPGAGAAVLFFYAAVFLACLKRAVFARGHF